jgi:flagellar biogenesis protein FliO
MFLAILWHLANSINLPNESGDLAGGLPESPPLLDAIDGQITSVPPGDYGATFVKMILTLTALIGLLFLTFWFLRRLMQQRLQKGNSQQAIQILEKRMISPKTMLYLVEVEKKKILLAESHLEIKRLENFSSTQE